MCNTLFTFDFYAEICSLLIEKGYRQSFFDASHANQKKVYLRHDVDFCPKIACQFARFEAQLGISSTYFVMMDTPLYNVFHTVTSKLLKEMLDMGHDIGLHFVLEDADDLKSLSHKIENQCSSLSHLIEKNVSAFSLHRSAYWIENGFHNADLIVPGKFNAYHPHFFKTQSYISDSNHHWRCNNPLDFVHQHSGDALQILTHPIWWTEQPNAPLDKINAFLFQKETSTFNYISENIEVFRQVNRCVR